MREAGPGAGTGCGDWGGASLTHGGLGAIILGTFFLSLPTF